MFTQLLDPLDNLTFGKPVAHQTASVRVSTSQFVRKEGDSGGVRKPSPP